jgi:hypothetical protein
MFSMIDVQNHKVERIWPEVNQRVNYPIKGALVEMVDREIINIDDDIQKFCVSNLCLKLAELGINRVVSSWNAHRVPGKKQFLNKIKCLSDRARRANRCASPLRKIVSPSTSEASAKAFRRCNACG